MRPALFSLHNKRLAKIWERKTHEAAMLTDTCPWAKRNVYIFQQQMVEALKERNAGIRQYLAYRKSRAASDDALWDDDVEHDCGGDDICVCPRDQR